MWLFVSAVLAAVAGCKRSAPPRPADPPPLPPPALGDVLVRDRTPAEGRVAGCTLDASKLADALRAQLAAGGVFASARGGGDAAAAGVATVTVELALEGAEVGNKGIVRGVAHLKVAAKPEGVTEPAFAEDVQAAAEAPYERFPGKVVDPGVLCTKMTGRLLHDLADGYLARLKLRSAPESEVLAAIELDRGEIRDEAIKIAGDRKLRTVVPKLLELLKDDDEAVRDAALGALLRMREQKAVKVLADTRSLRDRREMRKILDAVAILGGEEARAYLEFVAGAHDDDDIKRHAREALMKLDERRAP